MLGPLVSAHLLARCFKDSESTSMLIFSGGMLLLFSLRYALSVICRTYGWIAE